MYLVQLKYKQEKVQTAKMQNSVTLLHVTAENEKQ